MKIDAHEVATAHDALADDEVGGIGLLDLLTWLGQGKWLIAGVTLLAGLGALVVALRLPPIYTARTTLLPPGAQQQSSSAAALAALGSLGGLAGVGSKTPDELYVSLLKSDTVQRALAERFSLMKRYEATSYEALRRVLPKFIRVGSDKKTGIITVEVDDEEPKFAADLANAHAGEITKVLGRLAVSEAQVRRLFFEQQLNETKESLIKAEQDLRRVQEKSGVIVLDKQAEALIAGAALVRAQIAEREVQLKVLRTAATDQNPDVLRLGSELAALRGELAGEQDSGGSDRLCAGASRAQAARNLARKHDSPVRNCQARRGQGRPGAATGRCGLAAGLQVQTLACPGRARQHCAGFPGRMRGGDLARPCRSATNARPAAPACLGGDGARLAAPRLNRGRACFLSPRRARARTPRCRHCHPTR
jgi:capsular polysaccharide biosynthesis protein